MTIDYFNEFRRTEGAHEIEIIHTTAGLGLMADVQYWLTDRFYLNLSGSYNMGLLVIGDYSVYDIPRTLIYKYEMKLKTPTYMNVKLGLGWKAK